MLGEKARLFFERRAQHSFVAEEAKPGHIRLYNKNAMTTLHVRDLGQCPEHYARIVELDGPVPLYFAAVLRPIEGASGDPTPDS